MRKTLTCVKCNGRKVWHIAPVRERGQQYRPSPLGPAYEKNVWGQFRNTGAFEVFICVGCGYTEWYTTELDQLRHDPQNGITLIDNEKVAEGPYR
jgi:predicted nucleic-acid-binding Zn-ribbon protein